jgi:hypothetical protein
MKTIQQIDEEINALSLQKKEIEEQTLNQTIYSMFEAMTKEQVLLKIGQMMKQSPMLKMEVKRLLVDKII